MGRSSNHNFICITGLRVGPPAASTAGAGAFFGSSIGSNAGSGVGGVANVGGVGGMPNLTLSRAGAVAIGQGVASGASTARGPDSARRSARATPLLTPLWEVPSLSPHNLLVPMLLRLLLACMYWVLSTLICCHRVDSTRRSATGVGSISSTVVAAEIVGAVEVIARSLERRPLLMLMLLLQS